MERYDRFLEELREPVPRNHIERARTRVLRSLEAGEPARLAPVLIPVLPLRPTPPWNSIAAGVMAMVIAGVMPLALYHPVGNDVMARSTSGRSYRQGESIASRSGPLQLVLFDGSRIEMSSDAVLGIARLADGVRIFLSEGRVIVTAAKQHGGHLFVQTKDCEVSVVGTVFSVNAGPSGSRVSVVEGEVHVRHGERTQTLLPGQQVSTGAPAEPVSVKADVAWSANAPELVALLQQAAPAAQSSADNNPLGLVKGRVIRYGSTEGIPEVVLSLCPDPEIPGLTLLDDGRPAFSMAFVSALVLSARCETLTNLTTDESGRFLLKDLAPGRYVVRAQKSGYVVPMDSIREITNAALSRSLEKWSPEGGPTIVSQNIVVEDNAIRAVEVTLALVRFGTLTGKVRNSDNKLAAYVPVQLGIASLAGAPGSFRSLTSVNTNASGDYRFHVPPGEYLVFAGSRKVTPGSTEAEIAIPRAGVLRVSVREGEDVAVDPLVFHEPPPYR